ncbi:hypothetical protein J4430_02540 [Candidatus Woesearchaeota archaeon]|nr:hypothetical protein [Candidatus Woesearchaeota archaeon]
MKEDILKVIACPVCKENLKLEKTKLTCKKCKKSYEVKDGVPILK